LGAYADSVGAYFAVETGPEPSARLRKFLDSLPSNGVRVNLDPANLWMVCHDDPVQAVHNLAPYIVHTHAKDGDYYQHIDADMVYDMFAAGGIENIQITDYFLEKALGQGQVPWKQYLDALTEVGYTGYLTIEREVGPDPAKDIAEAIRFLRSM
jgi:sugar phosphate isomerase/epimerase